jgi:hypothetical protein
MQRCPMTHGMVALTSISVGRRRFPLGSHPVSCVTAEAQRRTYVGPSDMTPWMTRKVGLNMPDIVVRADDSNMLQCGQCLASVRYLSR